MIKGLAITPPVIGRIAIGKVVEKNGKRLPEKDDAFTITTQVQHKGEWILHPLHNTLLAQQDGGKLRSIPVNLLFNDPDLNLRAEYSLFDRKTGRPLCVGNGEVARRSTQEGYKTIICPGPQNCALGAELGCKPYGRLNVQIEGQEDDLGSFMFRTTGYNSIRTLAARLQYLNAVSGGRARYLPLSLKLRAKSTTQSHRAPVYYVDITTRDGINSQQALRQAREQADQSVESMEALETAAKLGLSNGAFEDAEEEGIDVVEEFFPVQQEDQQSEDMPVLTAMETRRVG
ncbi:hypothetical protein HF673_18850 [Acidithiobacillus thiooxidans]|jgi:hypothetical protein|uniref:Hydrolase or metal-binding protein n=1 Tax=Acidithiobacillus thiooxidans ATCC 19377 TaxID=637390 RepID=A0A5P9XSU7_ACITH|nr:MULTISPECIES: hypothetical protein [Acidithiobacillus]MDA8154366.1 hypothetical protein [Acidithiobacillus sp.]MBU2743055.1 hypothetical protein [Acidithiobacillus albertensis]MBU2792194.1 hypothetical protein [Acidithiobacillus thiooxidans]MBU2837733.1 hypothetical protein [Acidithiobacillus thiooxidans]QFX96750.1 hypothetical protein GCD22_02566 [Acidithiobacillus thiooxidans ATCC 19377]